MIRSHTAGRTMVLITSLLSLGACAVPSATTGEGETGLSPEVMTQLSLMAAPYQDLQSVRLQPEDGCYWYRHVGPVETTMLPLQSVDGRPICMSKLTETKA